MRWLLVGLLVVGCGASSRAIVGPDGQRWWSITCRRSQDNCYDEAAERCPRGYDVGDNSGGVSYVPNTYNGAMYPVYGGRMLVRCR